MTSDESNGGDMSESTADSRRKHAPETLAGPTTRKGADRTDGKSLRSGFLWHAQLTPDAPAVSVRGVIRSYGELHEQASRWAAVMTDACGGRPERVGLFAYRSETAYTGCLAALFSGATFVPLNPTFPVEKTAAMVERADLDAMIVDSTCLPQLSSVVESFR